MRWPAVLTKSQAAEYLSVPYRRAGEVLIGLGVTPFRLPGYLRTCWRRADIDEALAAVQQKNKPTAGRPARSLLASYLGRELKQ